MSPAVRYSRMPIEVESPEEYGYSNIRFNLSESSIADQSLASFGLQIPDLTLLYGEHRGSPGLRELIASADQSLGIDDVLICGGAAGALFIVATASRAMSSRKRICCVLRRPSSLCRRSSSFSCRDASSEPMPR